jgi:hypothetical protein
VLTATYCSDERDINAGGSVTGAIPSAERTDCLREQTDFIRNKYICCKRPDVYSLRCCYFRKGPTNLDIP